MKIPPAVSAAVHSELRGNITAICVSLSTFSGGISNSGTIITKAAASLWASSCGSFFPLAPPFGLSLTSRPTNALI